MTRNFTPKEEREGQRAVDINKERSTYFLPIKHVL